MSTTSARKFGLLPTSAVLCSKSVPFQHLHPSAANECRYARDALVWRSWCSHLRFRTRSSRRFLSTAVMVTTRLSYGLPSGVQQYSAAHPRTLLYRVPFFSADSKWEDVRRHCRRSWPHERLRCSGTSRRKSTANVDVERIQVFQSNRRPRLSFCVCGFRGGHLALPDITLMPLPRGVYKPCRNASRAFPRFFLMSQPLRCRSTVFARSRQLNLLLSRTLPRPPSFCRSLLRHPPPFVACFSRCLPREC